MVLAVLQSVTVVLKIAIVVTTYPQRWRGELAIEFLYLLSLELTSDGDLGVYGCLSLMSSVFADDLGEDLQCEGGNNEDMAHDMLAD